MNNGFQVVKKKGIRKPVARHKEMLCRNIIFNGICDYGSKCLFAHSLEEQNLSEINEQSYDMILKDIDLSEIDLVKDKELYNNLLKLTNVCESCINNKCQGGMNCRNGVCRLEYKICYNDLVFGNCINKACNGVHLTKKGLIPYTKRTYIKNHNMNRLNIIENLYKNGKDLDDDFFNDEVVDDTRNISIFDL